MGNVWALEACSFVVRFDAGRSERASGESPPRAV